MNVLRLSLGFAVGAISLFLILPILVVIPLSFNPEPYFSFTRSMLLLQPDGWSLRWYREVAESAQWRLALKNSVTIAIIVTPVATALGTAAALGLRHLGGSARTLVAAVLGAPLIIPVIIVATGTYLFFAPLGLTQSMTGIVIVHVVLAAPFVVVTVSGTLTTFDAQLSRAAATLGASPLRAFARVTLPLIAPGVISGALFAFVTSFDEAVVTLFLASYDQRTVPLQMWSGIRDQLSPAVLVVASLLVLLVAIMMVVANLVQALKRGGE
ncbi:putative spermidine/putrescine transport system permease protein [Rhizobium sp. PP-F2F-G48]|uniref:ABC transporter permease n=1 Tax=Rhizobium sp. PP-F2F-G48 TaxID=2135651 RepID=UPI0010476889|nr:ABC transporter permease [Rhizobium sp. PP-F2F-G48]TCM48340.1 putative spermidine/putrescine transport system permease protein [Rhizobium sp. PP-F2F-G48]